MSDRPAPPPPAPGSAPASERVPGAADLGPPTTLVLIRHGRTALTEQRRFSGGDGEDAELSATGRREAALAATAVASLGTAASWLPGVDAPTALFSSPRRRTRQTAEAVAAATGLEVAIVPGWNEIGFGDWDGRTLAELTELGAAEVTRWQGSASAAPPSGESLDDLVARVRAARAATVAAHPHGVVVVATHTTPVRAVVQEVLDAAPQALWRLQVSTGSITAARFWADGQCDVLATNVTGHLRP